MTTLSTLLDDLHSIADPEAAKKALRFVKAGEGEYAEGDQFIGIRNPQLRERVKLYRHLPLADIVTLLQHPVHECRHMALLLMVDRYAKHKQQDERERVYQAYLANTRYINNWDLVDASCYKIVGPHLFNRDRSILYQLAKSESLWERRIAMVSIYHMIKKNEFDDCERLALALLSDKQDLIHKATGWMLKEMGKRDPARLCAFLDQHTKQMSRTTLRYALEKLSAEQRRHYMAL